MLFPLLFLCSISVANVQEPFENLIWEEAFDEANENWRQSNNADELFLVQKGKYLLWRKNRSSASIILPQKSDQYGESRTETSLVIDNETTEGSGGLVCFANSKDNTAIIFEVNGKSQFRVKQLRDNTFSLMSGKEKNSGWVKDKSIGKAGSKMVISVVHSGTKLSFVANGKKVYEHAVDRPLLGRSGLYAGEASMVLFDYLRIYVSDEEAARIKKERESFDPVKGALTDVIVQLRNTINLQNRELDSLEKVLKKLVDEDDRIENSPRNVKKLAKEIADLKKENNVLDAKLKQLEKENDKLKAFKDNVQKGQGGDIVIKLSDLLASEKEKREALQKENDELKKKLEEFERKIKQED